MSKEAVERIKAAEKQAHDIEIKAKEDARKFLEQTMETVEEERALFYEKLKAERSERLRRTELQMKLGTEKTESEAKQKAEHLQSAYDKYLSRAAELAVNIVLGGGDGNGDCKNT